MQIFYSYRKYSKRTTLGGNLLGSCHQIDDLTSVAPHLKNQVAIDRFRILQLVTAFAAVQQSPGPVDDTAVTDVAELHLRTNRIGFCGQGKSTMKDRSLD